MWRLSSVAAGLAVTLVVGCSGAPEASTSPESSPSPELSPSAPASVTPSTSVATSPIETPSASPSPIASPPTSAPPTEQPPSPSAAAGPRWELLAETAIGLPVVDPDEETPNIVGFEAGYISYRQFDPEISFSADGVHWEQIPLPPSEPRCEDEGEWIVRGVTNRRSVLLLGHYGTDDCDVQTFAWLTEDGRNWRRSGPIGDPVGFGEAEPYDVWPVPGGWEAALGTNEDDTAILQSADGVTWTETATVAGWGSVDGAADAVGNRLLSLTVRGSAFGEGIQERLATSADGLTWTDLEAQFDRTGSVAVVSALEPPTSEDSAWILFVDEYDPVVSYPDDPYRGQVMWLSDDLSHWEQGSPPRASMAAQTPWQGPYAAATSEGLIATACNRRGTKCATYISHDAREWTPIIAEFPVDRMLWVAEGPAGVIAGTEEGAVYRLVP